MATVLPDRSIRRLGAFFACLAVLLLATAAWSDAAGAAKKGHAKATASKSKAKKGGRANRPKKVTATATTPVSSGTATPTPAAAGGIKVEVGEAVKVEVGAPTSPSAPTSSACGQGSSASVSLGLGTFSAVVRPTSCWRPYASSSPFNSAVASNRSSAGNSTAQISRLLSGGAISYFVAGDPTRDFGTAVYYPSSTDPTYVIQCTEAWGRCAIEGNEVHLPEGAIPSGPWPIGDGDADSHMTIVDQESGWEYDLWNIRSIGDGKIVTRWGGKTRIDGNGLGSDAVAAQFGSLAGIIRPAEMKSGRIEHALALTVPCTVGFVAPATKGGLECADAGMSTVDALPMGAHLQLQMSTGEIEAMNAPAWKKGILRAFATYGAYVEDTTGDSSQWGCKFESPNGSTSLGGPDEYVELAKSLGMEAEDYNNNGYPEYWFNVAGGVDWSKLRVVS